MSSTDEDIAQQAMNSTHEAFPASIFEYDVYMWGRGSVGQLGVGEKKKRKKPTLVEELSRLGVLQCTTGGSHSAAVTANGRLYVWGSGESGCLGRGDRTTLGVPRKLLMSGELRVSAVACGEAHTCFLSFDCQVYTVGANDFGQLGLDNALSTTIPKRIEAFDGKGISKIFCGPHQTAAISDRGCLYTWGDSKCGQLGHGFFFPQKSPKIVEDLLEVPVAHISFGGSFAVALTCNQELRLWGKTPLDFECPILPAPIAALGNTPILQVDCGRYHIAALTGGKVLTWGCGVHGQLGLGDKTDRDAPWIVKALHDYRITQVCCGAYHTMALTDCGRLFSWGDNQKFTLGHSPERREVLLPVQVPLPDSRQVLQLIGNGLTSGVLLGERKAPDGSPSSPVRMPRVVSYDFAESVPLKVAVASWNMNAQTDPDLFEWLVSHSSGEIIPDIVAVGFQELIELSSHSLAQDEAMSKITKTHLVRDNICKFWASKLQMTLDYYPEEFSFLKDIRLAGVYLAVFVKKSLRQYVQDVRAHSTKAGMLGKIGNKGGVAIRFTMYSDNTMCFVNSHLAAGQSNVEKRNEDYTNIVSSIRFDVDRQRFSISDHQKVFWLGDLNYRINASRNKVLTLLNNQDWRAMYPYDQLMVEREAGRVFEGFEEAPIYFAPTYKFDIGTQVYDTSEKCRCPAWCDRILFRGDEIYPLLYRSHPEYVTSDHKPISGWFSVMVRQHDMQKRLTQLTAASKRIQNERVASASELSRLQPQHSTPSPPLRPNPAQRAEGLVTRRASSLEDVDKALSTRPQRGGAPSPLGPRTHVTGGKAPRNEALLSDPVTHGNWTKTKPVGLVAQSKNAFARVQVAGNDLMSRPDKRELASEKLNGGLSFFQKKAPKIKGGILRKAPVKAGRSASIEPTTSIATPFSTNQGPDEPLL